MLNPSRIVLLGLLCPCLRLPAQERGAIVGKVQGPDSIAIAGVQVHLDGATQPVIPDKDGSFRLLDVPAARQLLRVRALGYAPASITVNVPRGDTARVIVILSAITQTLDTVAVRAMETPAALLGFEERRARGSGVFFTREQLDRMQVRSFTDVLRRVSGIQIRPVNGAYGENLIATSRGSRCPMSYYLNGTPLPVPSDVSINHFIDAASVVAVEVYTPSELPAQFNSSTHGARCGLVGIWTRSSR